MTPVSPRGVAVVIGVVLVATAATASGGPAAGADRSAASSSAASSSAASSSAGFDVRVPATLPAGQPLTVELTGRASDAEVTAIGTFGVRTLHARAPGTVRFAAGTSSTAGVLTVVARAGGRTRTGTTTIIPGRVVAPTTAVVGARSIVADGSDASMAVAIPVDRWGNAVADGSVVEAVRTAPDGSVSTRTTRTRDLLAWFGLISGTRAGQGSVAVSVDSLAGPAVPLLEVAAPPTDVVVQSGDGTDPGDDGTRRLADGSTLVALSTAVLRDRHGNVQPDGTQVVFTWDGPGGTGHATAATVSGVARTWLPSPTTPGTVRVSATCRGSRSSATTSLVFRAAVDRVPVTASIADGATTVRVGPVATVAGTAAPDGTAVRVVVRGRDGTEDVRTGRLRSGAVSVSVPTTAESGTASVRVSLLGGSWTAVPG